MEQIIRDAKIHGISQKTLDDFRMLIAKRKAVSNHPTHINKSSFVLHEKRIL